MLTRRTEILACPVNGRSLRILSRGTAPANMTVRVDDEAEQPLYGLPDLFDRVTWTNADPQRGTVQQVTYAASCLMRALPVPASPEEPAPTLAEGELAIGPINGRYIVARVRPGNEDFVCVVTARYAGVTALLCKPPPRLKPYSRVYRDGWHDATLGASGALAKAWQAALSALGSMAYHLTREGQFAAEGFPEAASPEEMRAVMGLTVPLPVKEQKPQVEPVFLSCHQELLGTCIVEVDDATRVDPAAERVDDGPVAAFRISFEPDPVLVEAWCQFCAAYAELTGLRERYRPHIDVKAEEREWNALFCGLQRNPFSWVDEEKIHPLVAKLEEKKSILASDPFPEHLFDAAEQAQDAAEDILMSTPAHGLTGAMVKLRYLQFITSVHQVRPTDPRFDEILSPMARITGRTLPGYADQLAPPLERLTARAR